MIFFFSGFVDGGAVVGLESVTREDDLRGFLDGSATTDPKTGGPSRCERVGGFAGEEERLSALAGASASEPKEMWLEEGLMLWLFAATRLALRSGVGTGDLAEGGGRGLASGRDCVLVVVVVVVVVVVAVGEERAEAKEGVGGGGGGLAAAAERAAAAA